MERLLRGLHSDHINTRINRVKPSGFRFKESCFSVFRQSDRTICEALNNFREIVAPYNYYASFNEADLQGIPHNPQYRKSPSILNPFHGTIFVKASDNEALAKQQFLVIRQELAEISSLVIYDSECNCQTESN